MERFLIPDAKSPWEAYYVEIDASKWLGSDTITGVSFDAMDSSGSTASSSVIIDALKCTYSTTKVRPYIRGGVAGEKYTVRCRVSSSGDNHREFLLYVAVSS